MHPIRRAFWIVAMSPLLLSILFWRAARLSPTTHFYPYPWTVWLLEQGGAVAAFLHFLEAGRTVSVLIVVVAVGLEGVKKRLE